MDRFEAQYTWSIFIQYSTSCYRSPFCWHLNIRCIDYCSRSWVTELRLWVNYYDFYHFFFQLNLSENYSSHFVNRHTDMFVPNGRGRHYNVHEEHWVSDRIPLVTDFELNILFWANYDKRRFACTDYGGKKHIFDGGISKPASMAIFSDDIFWTTSKSMKINWTPKHQLVDTKSRQPIFMPSPSSTPSPSYLKSNFSVVDLAVSSNPPSQLIKSSSKHQPDDTHAQNYSNKRMQFSSIADLVLPPTKMMKYADSRMGSGTGDDKDGVLNLVADNSDNDK